MLGESPSRSRIIGWEAVPLGQRARLADPIGIRPGTYTLEGGAGAEHIDVSFAATDDLHSDR